MSQPGRRATRLRRVLDAARAPAVVLPVLAVVLVAGGVVGRELGARVSPDQQPLATVTCWDGTPAAAGDCSRPRGVEGLAWVFPSFDPDAPQCRDQLVELAELDRPAQWICEVTIGDEPATITYSQLSSVRRGLAYLDGEYPTEAREPVAGGTRIRWTDPADSPRSTRRVTLAYAEAPYAVTVSAASTDVRDEVLETLVELRDDDELSERRAP